MIIILDKIGFTTKNVTRDKEGNFLIIKRPTYQEDITINYIYMSNNRAPKYTKQN